MKNENTGIEIQLLSIVRQFLSELEAERAMQAISLDAALDRDLGIDSLGKVELLHRIEKEFSVRLPDNALTEIKSLRDLAMLLSQTAPSSINNRDQNYTTVLEATALDLSSITVLTEALTFRALQEPNRPHIYLQDEEGRERIIRYSELLNTAKAVAAGLQKRGILPGETIAIMLPTSEEFFYAFAGILLAGAIPVPVYPPFHPDLIEEYAKREAKILKNAEVRILITFSRVKILSDMLPAFVPSLMEVTTLDNLKFTANSFSEIVIAQNDIALIQYTSGSTGDPKGVVLTHGNMIANIRAIGKSIQLQPTDVNVSWLPLYHDMGLLDWLASLYFGIPLVIMSPLIFLSRPEKWLWAMHYHRATLSGGPNFAYEMCVKEIDTKDIEGLDLSAWRFAFCGSETINPRTIKNFTKKFEPFGFKPESFAPAYGLAESTVGLSISGKKRLPRIDKIERVAFETKNQTIPTTSTNENEYVEFVSCGEIMSDHTVRIVDESDNPVSERVVGNIQFSGPSSMQGYHNNLAATQKAYHNGFWDTGDLGYLADNELFVTGRKKDLIIKAGRNLYPEEIEEIVNQIEGIERGNVIALGVSDPISGTEKLVIVAETTITEKNKQQFIRENIIKQLSSLLGLPPDVIVLVKPHVIPKTASGKLQRAIILFFLLSQHRLAIPTTELTHRHNSHDSQHRSFFYFFDYFQDRLFSKDKIRVLENYVPKNVLFLQKMILLKEISRAKLVLWLSKKWQQHKLRKHILQTLLNNNPFFE